MDRSRKHAAMMNLMFWRDRGGQSRRPPYCCTRSAFLRGMGLVYLAAFGSVAVQVDGLIGSRGILPAADYLARAARVLGTGPATFWRLPTLCWLDASDWTLYALCWGGVALSLALVAGLLPALCAVLLWYFYLSIVVVGQEFLSYQWDSLLLEAGLLAALLAPWRVSLRRASDEPPALAIWLVRWLVFRLMFLSGVVKLASQDPTWSDWRALEYHYQTQPLPTWTSWYIHQMPPWFHEKSVGVMFFAELVAPFFIVGPRPIRLVGFISMVLFQFLIAATGNYGFFNLLAVVLCLSLLDDRDVEWWRGVFPLQRAVWPWLSGRAPRPSNPTAEAASEESRLVATGRAWSWARRIVVGALGAVILIVTLGQTAFGVRRDPLVPDGVITLMGWVEPLRSFNSYGLFAVMTTKRPEIIIEGSNDGASWRPYRFRWKPCELNRPPRFTTPHMPRLDWQMWFAALAGDCRSQPWFIRFEQRLLEGSPEVLGLLRDNPFPDRPPNYVRARLNQYKFTGWGSADWWISEDRGLFCPPLALGNRE
jgi:hypothetical protein